MKRTWQAVGVIVGAAGLVLGGMGLAMATGDDPSTPKQQATAARVAAAAVFAPETPQNTFTPITPCRIADTRASGKVGTSGRSFYVAGTANFPAQGGTSGGCGIPAGAVAVAANLVAVNATTGGFLKAFPAGAVAPSASVLNYGTAALANELPLSVRSGVMTGLTVTASTPVNVLIDVTGYYTPQIEAYVNADSTIYSSTSAVTGVADLGDGSYTVSIDHSVQRCAVSVTPVFANVYAAGTTSGSTVVVRTGTISGGSYVATDAAFNLVVTC